MKYVIYGDGISNKMVVKYLDKVHLPYVYYQKDLHLDKDDIIVKGPSYQVLPQFKDNEIVTDVGLYMKFFKPKCLIVVTGSVGKTSTCLLLANLLKNNFKVCGNIGIPIFTYDDNGYNLICEASSYELEYSGYLKPDIFILLNIFKHHLAYHHTFINYIEAKLNVIKKMNHKIIFVPEDVLLFNQDNEIIKIPKASLNQHQILSCTTFNYPFFEVFVKRFNLDINYLNTLIKKMTFKHRLELVLKKANYIIINDSKSTSFNSTLNAYKIVKKVYPKQLIHVIIGGIVDDVKLFKSFCKTIEYDKLYAFGRVGRSLKALNNVKVYNTLEQLIIDIPLNKNEIILFSPGGQSFDLYDNYEQRGNHFKKLIVNKYLLLTKDN